MNNIDSINIDSNNTNVSGSATTDILKNNTWDINSSKTQTMFNSNDYQFLINQNNNFNI